MADSEKRIVDKAVQMADSSVIMGEEKKRTIVLRFMQAVNEKSVGKLLGVVEEKLREGIERFVLLVSSPGGSVFHGLSAYNYLKGVPAEVVTHNFGSVDSIGVVLFCAGSLRYSVPHARFLLHGVQTHFPQATALEELQLEERLKGLKMDVLNIARVVAANSKKTPEEISKMIIERKVIDPQEALRLGLIHEMKSDLFQAGTPVIAI